MKLESYINKKNELNNLKSKLESLEQSSDIKTPCYTTAAATTEYKEHLTDRLIKIEDLKQKIYDTTIELLNVGLTLGEKIDNLQLSIEEKAILRYRYILGYKFDLIASKLELSQATIFRKLKTAVTEFGTREILSSLEG